MIREHLVNGQITNNGECICNPEVLLGTNYGVFNLENEIAPRGMLLDLNAAWELFFSKKDLYNLRFRKEVSPQGTKTVTLNNETAEQIEVAEDETLWILWDTDSGKDTNAWLKTDKSYGVSLNDLEFENETLYLYYDQTRILTDNEYSENPEVPYHYYRNDGTPTGDRNDPDIVKDDQGQPFIFQFTGVPKDKIFDEHELHTLFPWYADPSHIVRLKQNIDNSTNTHPSLRSGNTPTVLGDMTITPQSEVFVGENPNREHIYEKGNELVSLQSIFEQLKVVLGVVLNKGNEITSLSDKGQWYDDHNTAGESKHYRYESNNFKSSLNHFPESVNNVVDALNELNTGLNQKAWESIIKLLEMINGKPVDTSDGEEPTPSNIIWNLTRLNETLSQISGGTDNYIDIVDVLNYLSDQLGDLEDALEDLGEDLRGKIGYNFQTEQWLELLPNRQVSEWDPGLTNQQARVIKAINYIDGLIKNTSDEIGERCGKYTRKENNEYVYTLWSAICELTDRVASIEEDYLDINNWGNITNYNEGDTFVDIINNLYHLVEQGYTDFREKIGWDYTKTSPGDWKDLSNHFATSQPLKTTMPIIDALNQLGDEIDELGSESPFEYVNKNDKENCGVRLKNRQNDPVGNGTFIVGSGNESDNELGGLNAKGKNNFIIGNDNALNDANDSYALGMYNTIDGNASITIGQDNHIYGGSESYAFGSSNEINNTDSRVIGVGNTVNSSDTTVIGIGNTINSQNSIVLSNDGTQILNNNMSGIISIGKLTDYYSNSTHIGKDIYIQEFYNNNSAQGVVTKLQDSIFINLNEWAAKYATTPGFVTSSTTFNGLNSVTNCIKQYVSSNIVQNLTNNPQKYILKFTYRQDGLDSTGIALIEGGTARLIVDKTTYLCNNLKTSVSPTWHRREGIKLVKAQVGGDWYLAFADQNYNSSSAQHATQNQEQNSNISNILLDKAFGGIPLSDLKGPLGITLIEQNIETKLPNTAGIDLVVTGKKVIPDSPNCPKPTESVFLRQSNIVQYDPTSNKYTINLDLSSLQHIDDKGKKGGYVPLNCNGLIDLQYIPGQTYEVIQCWAEYTLEDPTDEQSDILVDTIHLFTLQEVSSSDITNTGTSSDPVYIYHYNQQDSQPAVKQNDKYYIKGEEITSTGNYPSDPADITKANPSALYIEASKTTNPIHQFKWTGGFWTPYKGQYLTIGHDTGTALDGKEGWDHITDVNNPHGTTLTKITPEIFVDPHYPTWHTDPDYPGQFPGSAHNDQTDESTGTAWQHVQELYTRLNQTEDLIIQLDQDIDAIPEDGPILKEHIAYSVNTFFNLYG